MLRTLCCLALLGLSWQFSAPCKNKAYDQCDGKGWSGDSCCPAGFNCTGDQYYKQCIPAGPPKLDCTTDADCATGETCVIVPDRSYAQCISCGSSFNTTCASFGPTLLIAAEKACGAHGCPGRCPNHTDTECATGQKCAFSSDNDQDKCLDCGDDAKFSQECWSMSPAAFLKAGLTTCGRTTCSGRCPGGTDAECAAGLVCVMQLDGHWDQCVDCTPKKFQDDCTVWKSQGETAFVAAAEQKCGIKCDVQQRSLDVL